MILVVEDEPGIVDFIERGLRKHGFDVTCATDGERGLESALQPDVELMVLDLNLPALSGLDVLAALQARRPALPVIVLTASGDIEDRIAGLDAGAVDYLVKPFSVAELAARIRAQLRSSTRGATTLHAGGIHVDLLTRQVHAGDRPVRLSSTEFELLVYLMQNRPQVLTREQLLRAVWGYEHDPGTNVLEVYIGYLRRKLRASADAPTPITTVRSVGYRFEQGPS
jgi:DNA-binding response OmpR family regulator